jgi:uncharacterized protein YbcC (UPF0753/DUF2309 family)
MEATLQTIPLGPDCGACAASPGRHNARMLAKIANIPVRQALKENHNIGIPASTIFIEENTIPLQMRYCFSTQRFQTLIKTTKLKLNLLKNNKRQLKKGWLLPITVLLC